jgi:predicted nucleic acid-binding protein
VAAFFLDTSALVKRYVSEIGTSWVNSLLNPGAGNAIYLARIAGVELVAAITRRSQGGSISVTGAAAALAQFRLEFAGRFHIVALTPRLIAAAMTLAETHALRAYDAVQLAAALTVDFRRRSQGLPRLILVSADSELNAAALAEGVAVEDPNTHP